MNDPETKFDQLLKSHLARELDGHLGRSARAFAAEVNQPAQLAHDQRVRRIYRYWAAAAAMFIVASVIGVVLVRKAFQQQIATGKIEQKLARSDSDSPPLMPIAQSVAWQTLDDGTVMLAGDIPVRRLRRQVVEHIRWYDPKLKTTVELSVPQEQVMLIGQWTRGSGAY